MKKFRKLAALFLAFAMVIAASGTGSVTASAKSDYMKSLGVKTGIKVGKEYTFKTKTSFGSATGTWKLKKAKVSDADEDGYKTLTCTLVWTNKMTRPSNSAINKLCNSGGSTWYPGNFWYAVVDKYTGKSLEKSSSKIAKKLDVTVEDSDSTSGYKTYKTSSGNWISYYKKWIVKLTITYPEDYDGLMIGFGSSDKVKSTSADNKFFKGKGKFAKTSYWKSGKSYSRWLYVSNLD